MGWHKAGEAEPAKHGHSSGHDGSGPRAVPCAVLTISDTRTEETDTSGRKIQDMLKAAGHPVSMYHILPDEPTRILALVHQGLAREDVWAVILNGGTGLSVRDVTFEALNGIIEKPLPGFGELFRMLSYQDIGPAAMLSRAMAGATRGKVIFSVPGSTKAVELAMEKLILPQLGHVVHELRRQAPSSPHSSHLHTP
ncbi:MAG: MogA/MoaB family molybdenum cofactor biosynthesis protein [Deltaproteobacteria bacterium]|nr:MogA/MoaB family molybdenum cofactor biosynthesis protein [Deltaproteobacteria bacterium]